MATRRLLGLSRLQVFLKLIGESIFFTAIAFGVAYLLALVLQDKAMEMARAIWLFSAFARSLCSVFLPI